MRLARSSERSDHEASSCRGRSFAAALVVADIVLLIAGHEPLNNAEADLVFGIVTLISTGLYVAIGLLIAVRARNVIGWFLTGVGISYGLLSFGNAYAAVGLITFPGSLPAAKEIATAGSQLWIFALVALSLLLLLFPDGRPPSPSWRLVLWLGIGGSVTVYLLFLLQPATVNPVGDVTYPNPPGRARRTSRTTPWTTR
jgi:hypothetical protein